VVETQSGDISAYIPHQRHLHHRRPDLPRGRALPLGAATGDQRRALGLPRGRRRPVPRP
jgi:hypothetical protein